MSNNTANKLESHFTLSCTLLYVTCPPKFSLTTARAIAWMWKEGSIVGARKYLNWMKQIYIWADKSLDGIIEPLHVCPCTSHISSASSICIGNIFIRYALSHMMPYQVVAVESVQNDFAFFQHQCTKSHYWRKPVFCCFVVVGGGGGGGGGAFFTRKNIFWTPEDSLQESFLEKSICRAASTFPNSLRTSW